MIFVTFITFSVIRGFHSVSSLIDPLKKLLMQETLHVQGLVSLQTIFTFVNLGHNNTLYACK